MLIENEIKELKNRQVQILEALKKQSMQKSIVNYYTNEDLINLLKVSRRTLSTWRETGKIGYRQIGAKIIYTQNDVDQFIKKNHYESYR